MASIIILAIIYVILLVLWLGYIVVMTGMKHWNNLHWFVKTNLLPFAAVFVLLDVTVNIIIGSLLFLEVPLWWTLSERLNYHATHEHGWKTYLATWMCKNLLNPFDPSGKHCGR